jgi:hypothetical protein
VELLVWIAVGIVVGLAVLALAPLLIVGSWFMIITAVLGLADGAIWLLDQGWRPIRPEVKPVSSPGLGDVTH